jgi:osmotically-inducible protein OsmY
MDRYPTDEEVRADVRAQLDWELLLDAADIDVQVHDGVVVLNGQVSSCLQQWAAEQAAQQVSGVRCMRSKISVALPGWSRHGDADISRSAQNMLHSITLLPTRCIKAVVVDGWITLSGSVDWDYQKQAATAAVRHVVGATGVTDLIVVDKGGPSRMSQPEIDLVLG